jgi:hypothetical protein
MPLQPQTCASPIGRCLREAPDAPQRKLEIRKKARTHLHPVAVGRIARREVEAVTADTGGGEVDGLCDVVVHPLLGVVPRDAVPQPDAVAGRGAAAKVVKALGRVGGELDRALA